MKPGQKLIDIIKGNRNYVLTGHMIKEICSKHFSVSIEAMESRSRKKELVQARQAAIYLMKLFTNYSLLRIANHFSDRDHTTAIHSIQVVKNSIDCKDDYLNYDIQILEAACIMEEARLMRESKKVRTVCDPCPGIIPISLKTFSSIK